ncbi:hypothetical protein ACTVH1_18890 [Gluconobacter cerinus]
MARPRSVEIYLQEGVPEDDYIHDISRMLVSQGRGRRQDIFRRALMIGLTTLLGPESHSQVEPRSTIPAARRRKRVVVSDARVQSKPVSDQVEDFLEAELTDFLQADDRTTTEPVGTDVLPDVPAKLAETTLGARTAHLDSRLPPLVPQSTQVPEQTPSREGGPPPDGRSSRRLGRLM